MLLVVQAVMVNVVDYEMVGCVFDLAVHLDAFAFLFANGVVCFVGIFCKPGKFAELGVVFSVYDGELAAGQRYDTWFVVFGVGGS